MFPRINGGSISFGSLCGALSVAFGMGIDTISGFVTAPGATLTALTPATGDSFTLKNNREDKQILLLDLWARNQAAGIFRVRSTKLHDNTQGLRFRVAGNTTAFPLGNNPFPQLLYAQDVLTVEQSGSAVAGDLEMASLLTWYEDLKGTAANLITPDEVNARAVELYTQETTMVSGAGGSYTGSVALNSTFPLMKANTDYAYIGGIVDASCTTVTIKGPDSSNLRIGFPGIVTIKQDTRNFFWDLSVRTKKPCICVFNAANAGATFTEVVTDENAGTFNANFNFVELTPKK